MTDYVMFTPVILREVKEKSEILLWLIEKGYIDEKNVLEKLTQAVFDASRWKAYPIPFVTFVDFPELVQDNIKKPLLDVAYEYLKETGNWKIIFRRYCPFHTEGYLNDIMKLTFVIENDPFEEKDIDSLFSYLKRINHHITRFYYVYTIELVNSPQAEYFISKNLNKSGIKGTEAEKLVKSIVKVVNREKSHEVQKGLSSKIE